jgi:hypothetical protein
MERPDFRALPPIPEELLKDLESRFPARCPDLTEEDRRIWFYAGQRSVVEFLRKAASRQFEDRFNI